MDRARRLLELATRMGIETPDAGGDDEARLSALVASGALSPGTLAELEKELGELESGPTQERPGHAPRPATPAGDGRFVLDSQLGAGGMGEVWRARDQRLGRTVALKLLRRDDEAALARFVREAQAQARLEHPHICRVYETGELRGRPYIAMELVDGETLTSAVRWPLRDKIAVMRQVAEAVEAAHAKGLVHRDLKPSNVLVRRLDDGGWHAYVTDFGLARDLGGGASLTRDVVGTPEFMAPEQARGGAVDARTDLWSLGATLYGLCSGRPPFTGTTAEVLGQVVSGVEPEPLRDAPPGVRAMVEKCMQPDPARRYPTARALADDLGRFLDGESLSVRPEPGWARALRRLRKRPARVAVALAAAATLATAAWAIAARRSAARDVELASGFAETAATVEVDLRQARLMPPHDLGADLEAARARVRSIAAARPNLDGRAAAAADDALGRAALALGDADAAVASLARAWSEGRRGGDTALALATARARVYRDRLAALPLVAGEADRKARRAKLAETLGAEVARTLADARAAGVRRAEYVEALLAYFEQRYDDGLAHAERAAAQDPTFYEALAAAGDLQVARGKLDEAAQAYARAREIGRSDPEVVLAQCKLALERVQTVAASGGVTGAAAEAGFPDCEAVGALVRDDARGLIYAAFIARAAASSVAAQRGPDAGPWLDRAEAYARRAVATAPGSAQALMALGAVLGNKGKRAGDTGQGDPLPALREGIAMLERAARLPGAPAEAWRNLETACFGLANLQQTHGQDPGLTIAEGDAAAALATALDPTDYASWMQWGLLDGTLARWEQAHGRAWRELDDRALAHLQRGVDLKPEMVTGLLQLGWVWVNRAEMERSDGGDPRAAERAAIATFERAHAEAPQDAAAMNLLAVAWAVTVSDALDRGEDPRPLIAKARPLLDKTVELLPNVPGVIINAASSAWQDSLAARGRGDDPEAAVARTLSLCARVVALDPRDANCPYLVAGAETVRAEYALTRGQPDAAGAALDRAEAALRQGTANDPDNPSGLATICDERRVRALALAGKPEAAARAVAEGLAAADRLRPSADGLWCALRLELVAGDRRKAAADLMALVKKDPRRAPRLTVPWGEAMRP